MSNEEWLKDFQYDSTCRMWTCRYCGDAQSIPHCSYAKRHYQSRGHQANVASANTQAPLQAAVASAMNRDIIGNAEWNTILNNHAIPDPRDSPPAANDWEEFYALDANNGYLEPSFTDLEPTSLLEGPNETWVQRASAEDQYQSNLQQMIAEGAGRDEEWIAAGRVRDGEMIEENEERDGTRRTRGGYHDPEWFPWSGRLECTVDVVANMPRAVLSDSGAEVMLMMLRLNGASDVPSLRQIKLEQESMASVKSVEYKGALGHPYFVNCLGDILAQELANPMVCQHLEIYPEDAGPRLKEVTQASKWLSEMPGDEGTPMIRLHDKDYYVFEPAMLSDGRRIMPTHWFLRRDGQGLKTYHGTAWIMNAIVRGANDVPGWRVNKHETITFRVEDLSFNYPQLKELGGTPPAGSIWGLQILPTDGDTLVRWDMERHPLPNPWRTKAKGRRVISLPIWLYCDDTSGNRSKKWNEHNSFLFILGGLPRHIAQKDYNVHFLCTSNLAPPLEMLEGVVDQIDEILMNGSWAYHAGYKETVILTVSVNSMLGDNPMQSEFSCHIGMKGLFFCRCCDCMGRDRDLYPNPKEPQQDNVGREGPNGRRRKPPEAIDSMMERAERFMKLGKEREPQTTKQVCVRLHELAESPWTASARRTMRTETGVKDALLDVHHSTIDRATKDLGGTAAEAAMKKAFDKLPVEAKRLFSSVWRIRRLNPHTDTPTEILHVILLGIVKYFWRDAMTRLTDEEKQVVATRLRAVDLTGLDPTITNITAETYVQYAGSLVGRDFRVIIQVAPFILYGLLDKRIYDAWTALTHVVRLAWQAEIADKFQYVKDLQDAIDNFLNFTALWTVRWFNKPKFHLLLHLPKHVLRFGPAILFATETFESFNAIIRSWSIHSNRMAPSRDIAASAASWNRVRHVVSGAYFPVIDEENTQLMETAPENVKYRRAGSKVIQMIARTDGLRKKLGLDLEPPSISVGSCNSVSFDPLPALLWRATFTSAIHPAPANAFGVDFITERQLYKRAHRIVVNNGDIVQLTTHAVVSFMDQSPRICVIKEILRRADTESDWDSTAEVVGIELCNVGELVPPYQMPIVTLSGTKLCVKPQDILCSVNVQHNCSNNDCDTGGTRVIREERRQTERTRPAVRHYNDADVILNTARMRDAKVMQQFVRPLVVRDRKEVLEEAKENMYHRPLP